VKDIMINSISKSYGEKRVLSGLSLALPAGSRTALMGPSGCGKTTLANILLGLVPPSGGEVQNLPARLSAVFQEDRLIGCLSPFANLRFAAGRSVGEREMTACLAELGISGEDAARSASGLSGGMKRRVAIARALLVPFDLIILDEPFQGLDDATRAQAAHCIARRAAGKTMLLITHSREEAALLNAAVVQMPPLL